MAIQFSDTVRNARLDQIETTVSTAPKLQIRSGTVPANTAAADAGTLLAEITLPSDWMSAASGGAKAKLGTWSVAAVAGGIAQHFRIKNNAGSVTHIQGTVTASGGGGDMTLDNTSIAIGQTVEITTFTITDGNA
jgi:hypothetical protein